MYLSSPELIGPRYFTAGVSGDEKATGVVGNIIGPEEEEEDTSPGCTK